MGKQTMLRTFTSVTAAAILAVSAPASALTVDLVGSVVAGEFEGTVGTGQLTFDENLLVGLQPDEELGFATLSPDVDPMFALTFTIFGQTFTEADDVDAPEFPSAFFGDTNELLGIDFQVSEFPFTEGGQAIEIDQEGVFEIAIFPPFFLDILIPDLDFPFGVVNEGGVIGLQEIEPFEVLIAVNNDFGVVPLPATLPMLLGALALGGVALRRRKAA